MSNISFVIEPVEAELVVQIVERYFSFLEQEENKLHVWMDIVACHANGNPLRLADLLKADDFNFLHDCAGIERNLCRETGRLQNSFLPRFSVPRNSGEVA